MTLSHIETMVEDNEQWKGPTTNQGNCKMSLEVWPGVKGYQKSVTLIEKETGRENIQLQPIVVEAKGLLNIPGLEG
jgi:hypothetical protein